MAQLSCGHLLSGNSYHRLTHLIVATKLEKGRKEFFNSKDPKAWAKCQQFEKVKARLYTEGLVFPILPLKKSAAFDRLFTNSRSIEQMRMIDPLLKGNYRDVSAHFDLIFRHIEEVQNGKQQSKTIRAA